MDKKGDQLLPEGKQKHNRHCQHAKNHPELEAHAVFDAFLVAFSVILGCIDPRSGKAAENAEVEHEHQLVHDGHAGHLIRADLSHHDIVQHPDKIRDSVLNCNRHRDRQDMTVEAAAADIT